MKKHKFRYAKFTRLLLNTELKKNVFKFIKYNVCFNSKLRQKVYLLLTVNFKNNNFNKSKLFCLMTGRTRYVLKKFRISRLTIKKFTNSGYNTGYYKDLG